MLFLVCVSHCYYRIIYRRGMMTNAELEAETIYKLVRLGLIGKELFYVYGEAITYSVEHRWLLFGVIDHG